ncbi:hypothetical protein G9A89_001470 [Geosiphon pyriformis]|nr:hypothetical protein G9A89_001470 [Geosiphon pyriformis]
MIDSACLPLTSSNTSCKIRGSLRRCDLRRAQTLAKYSCRQQFLSAARWEGELIATEENVGTKKRKGKATAVCGKCQKIEGILNGTWYHGKRMVKLLFRISGMKENFAAPSSWHALEKLLRLSITDEGIDQALVARKKVIKRNAQR